jgi:hypothetical protein
MYQDLTHQRHHHQAAANTAPTGRQQPKDKVRGEIEGVIGMPRTFPQEKQRTGIIIVAG